jgi:uncharacterized protein
MWPYILTAIALVLVFEGLMPFLSPYHWRSAMIRMARLNDRVLRTFGFIAMVIGAVLMYCVHSGIFDNRF